MCACWPSPRVAATAWRPRPTGPSGAGGEPGDGTSEGPQSCSDRFGNTIACSTIPVRVKNLTAATAVAAGDYHSVAVKSDGSVWAWGVNGYGELGDGTTIQRLIPVRV